MKIGISFYLPGWNILSELLIDYTTYGHDVGITRILRSVVDPQIVFKVLTEKKMI